TRWPRDWSSDVCSSDLSNVRQELTTKSEHFDVESRHGNVLQFKHEARSLRNRDAYRRGRDGRGVQSPRYAAESYGRDQGSSPGRSEERRVGKEGIGGWR